MYLNVYSANSSASRRNSSSRSVEALPAPITQLGLPIPHRLYATVLPFSSDTALLLGSALTATWSPELEELVEEAADVVGAVAALCRLTTVTTSSWSVPEIRYSGAMWSAISRVPSEPESVGAQLDHLPVEPPCEPPTITTPATTRAPIAIPMSIAVAARNFAEWGDEALSVRRPWPTPTPADS